MIKQPFNANGSLRVLPVCDSHRSHEDGRILEIDEKSWDASVFGKRLADVTEEDTPLTQNFSGWPPLEWAIISP